jgi:hypothetical protein
MVVDIASVRLKIILNEREVFFSPYLKEIFSVCSAEDSQCDFTVHSANSGASLSGMGRELELNGIRYRELSAAHFEFSVRNARFSLFFDRKVGEIVRGDNELIHDDLIVTFLKLLVSLLILEKGGLPLHCAAVCGKDNGYLFCGKSGSGKSTLALRLQPRYTILNDEFNVVVPDAKNGFRVYATPFTKQENLRFCSMISCSASRLFFFLDEKRKKIVPDALSGRIVLSLILENAFVFPTTDYFACRMFDNAAAIATAIPIETIADRDAIADRLLDREV